MSTALFLLAFGFVVLAVGLSSLAALSVTVFSFNANTTLTNTV